MNIPSRFEILSPASGSVSTVKNGQFFDVTIDATGQTAHGLGKVVGDSFAIAIGPVGKMEIGAYMVAGDRATGTWIPPGAKGDDLSICGREKLVRDPASGASRTVWKIEEAVAIDGSRYEGQIIVEPAAEGIVKMTWDLADGKFESVGIVTPGGYVSCWNVGEPARHGIIVAHPQGETWKTTQLIKGELVLTRGEWRAA